MQIGNALGQYQANMQRSPNVKSTGETEKSAPAARNDALSGLSAGNVFEGTISGMKNGQVRISLPDGSQISARLGADIPLQEGQSMFFEVKSNEGGLIEIRPFETPSGMNNPTILSALSAAGISATPEHVRMVDTMMQESLSIDKNSLASMSRLITKNPDIAPETLIQMQKYGLPISREMASQFENYRADSHQILNKMNEILTAVTDTLGGEEMSGKEALALNEKLIGVLTGEGMAAEAETAAGMQENPAAAESVEAGNAGKIAEEAAPQSGNANAVEEQAGKTAPATAEGEAVKELAAQTTDGKAAANPASVTDNLPQNTAAADGKADPAALTAQDPANTQQKEVDQEPVLKTPEGMKNYAQGTVGELLGKPEIAEMEKSLATLDKNGTLRSAGLSLDMKPEEFARALSDALKELPDPDEKALKNLLSGKGYLSVLKEMTREQWTVKPENLSGDRIKDLYENLDRQMRQTEHVLREMGMKDSELAKSVSDLKNNLEFMDQVNQHYTYLQIPFRLQNQNAHSDLYVYTNKKNLNDPNAELSAFLHLDMEHLGSTDVSIRMKNHAVNTKFYMEDDAAFNLILSHADELQKRLEKKGYTCKVEAVNEEKDVDFVEDFLKAGGAVSSPGSSHLIHRYSFDIKA